MSRKWIRKQIEVLDEERDYDEIWKLMTAYRANDFVMNLIYTITFPHFVVREFGATVLLDGGDGKIIHKADHRADDTSWKMQTWWHYGSNHERTIKNVESVNRLHEYYAKKYPGKGIRGSFADNDSYLYTLCYEVAGMHRLFQRIGLEGYTDKEKRVAMRYWLKMASYFRNAETGEPISEMPTTFDEVMQYMDRYESEDPDVDHTDGKRATELFLQQFSNRYFPRVLDKFARAWILSLLPDHIIKVFELKRPIMPVVKAFRWGTAAFFWVGEHIAPDPTTTFIERRDAKLQNQKAISEQKHVSEKKASNTSGCPFHYLHKQSDINSAATKERLGD